MALCTALVSPIGSAAQRNQDPDASVFVETGAPSSSRSAFRNFGAPENAKALAKIKSSPADYFHYVQIGDSHTAGDYLTDELRVRLQALMGDGGLGWAMPMWAKGQRLSRIGYDQTDWELISSRTANPEDYAFGGLIARTSVTEAQLTIKAKGDDAVTQHVTALVKQQEAGKPLTILDNESLIQQIPVEPAGRWTHVEFTSSLPFTVVSKNDAQNLDIGGWWLRGDRPGAIVSAVGINGAQLQHMDRWRADWVKDLALGKPSVVALSFGTNEALDTDFEEEQFRDLLGSMVDQLRKNLPGVAVLIIGAPESLTKQAGGACGVRLPKLDAVQNVQRQVAASKRTLYWDWQQAMGGRCSMKRWVKEGLARKDGVHFSEEGYREVAGSLFNGLRGR